MRGVTKGLEERIDGSVVLRWFGHVERMIVSLRGSMYECVLVVAQWVSY